MALDRIRKASAALAVTGVIMFLGMNLTSPQVRAQQDSEQDLIAIGLKIAPSFLKLAGKDPNLVGLGSYIVNAQADCNGCHGSDPVNEYVAGHNPYLLPPLNMQPQYNQATYLNGGQNFGPVGPGIVQNPSSPLYGGPGLGPNIITRNLTPDYTGNPEGGNSLGQFIAIMRTGHDFDKLHQNCGGPVTDNCYLPPIDGSKLLVMPWPKFGNMTDNQLTAIWTYLSTVPCNAHNDNLGNLYPWLKNKCS